MAKGSVRKKGKKWYFRFYVEDESGNRIQKEMPGTESKSETESLMKMFVLQEKRRRMERIMKNFFIRKASNGDEAILAYIQTESWKLAFKNIVSDDLLAGCTEINRATEMYHKLLENKKGNGYILEVQGKPHCIAWWDATRESDMPGYAELICIHSLPNNWHNGYGSKMMNCVLGDIRKSGYQKVMLWVFIDNHRACNFYETKGFVATDKVQVTLGATEIMYVYTFQI